MSESSKIGVQRFHKQGIWLNSLVVLKGKFEMSGRENKITLFFKTVDLV